MKKGLITIILTFILIFNTYSPTFATSPDPAAAIPVTAYEVYTYFTFVLTYMGVEYKNAQERKQWLEDEYGPDTPTYQSVEDILRKAKINFSNEPPNYNPKSEPRMIAIPVPDSLINDLYDKVMDYFTPDIPVTFNDFLSSIYLSYALSSYSDVLIYYRSYYNQYFLLRSNSKFIIENKEGIYTYPARVPYGRLDISNIDNISFKVTRFEYSSSSNSYYNYNSSNVKETGIEYYSGDKNYGLSNVYQKNSGNIIELPIPNFKKSWTSPYTGMQTVTMPLTTTGIESLVEIPVIPGEYVEPAPDEVTNPITQPVTDPLINPETGLPFIGPDGLPIFPSVPLVPETPITPIPEPEELTQPKDYTPNLTEISNGIKQLPERIINPIKKLFIPDKVSKIDFSPLNVPITRKFPFSIPFDLANMFQNFSAGGEPPKWDINLVFMDYSETVTIDLAMFEKWAEIIRFFVFIGFNIGLILITRNLIRG